MSDQVGNHNIGFLMLRLISCCTRLSLKILWGARWLSGRALDFGASGQRFEPTSAVLLLLLFSLTSLSRLFHSYGDKSIGRWGKKGAPRENHLTHPQAELGLYHMWPVRGSNLPTRPRGLPFRRVVSLSRARHFTPRKYW